MSFVLGALAALCILGLLGVLLAPGLAAGPVSSWSLGAAPGSPRLGAMLLSSLAVGAIAGPLAGIAGVFIAGWISFARRPWLATLGRRLVAVLASAPTVVLGWVGLSLISPGSPGLLPGALVLAIMALPTVIVLAERALDAVPSETLVASYSVGADRWTTLWRVAVPAAWRGLLASALLGLGRVMGEAVVAVLACGDRVALPGALDQPVRTLAAHVVLAFGQSPAGSVEAQGVMLAALLLAALVVPPVVAAALLGPPDAEAL